MIKRNRADWFFCWPTEFCRRVNTLAYHRKHSQNLFDFYHICLFDNQTLKCCEVGGRMGMVIGKLINLIHYAARLASFWCVWSVSHHCTVESWGGTLWKKTSCSVTWYAPLSLPGATLFPAHECHPEPRSWPSYYASDWVSLKLLGPLSSSLDRVKLGWSEMWHCLVKRASFIVSCCLSQLSPILRPWLFAVVYCFFATAPKVID